MEWQSGDDNDVVNPLIGNQAFGKQLDRDAALLLALAQNVIIN